MIDGKTRICGLFGNPVEHTLSLLFIIRLRSGVDQYGICALPGGRDQVKQAVEGARLQLLG
ncbi:MAG: hypothetical protein ACLVLH_06090 [Eisenbergiella massiliensis]